MGSTVSKNAKGYGYKYTDIAEIHNWLEEQGYSYQQYIEVIDGNDYIVTIPIMDGEEQPHMRGCRIVNAVLSGKSNPAQEAGAAITYARRYSLLMAFGLATVDNDAEEFTRPKESIEDQKISEVKVRSLENKCIADSVPVEKILKKFSVKRLEELTEKQFAIVCHNWTKEFVNGDKGKD